MSASGERCAPAPTAPVELTVQVPDQEPLAEAKKGSAPPSAAPNQSVRQLATRLKELEQSQKREWSKAGQEAIHAILKAMHPRQRAQYERKQVEREIAAKKAILKAMTPYQRAVHDLKRMEEAKRRSAKHKRESPLHGLQESSNPPLDRSIYQTRGAHPVSGGLPSLGRRS